MLKVIEENVFREYAIKNPYFSIYQLPEWGILKSGTGFFVHVFSFFSCGKIHIT